MKKYCDYFIITLLFIISLIYTDNITNIAKDKDPIMKKIKEEALNLKIESVNAKINNNNIIPGINGYELDINKSYENMKKINTYNEKLFKYKDIITKISISNIFDKYITSGNKVNRNISIVVYIKDNIEIISKINGIKLNVFINSNIIKNKKIKTNNNIKIYNGGEDLNYSNINIINTNTYINNNYNTSNYCLNLDKNDNNLLECSKNKMHTINPFIVDKKIYNTKVNITNGSILYFDENTIDKLDELSSYIIKKGYNIVYLDELLSEKVN